MMWFWPAVPIRFTESLSTVPVFFCQSIYPQRPLVSSGKTEFVFLATSSHHKYNFGSLSAEKSNVKQVRHIVSG